MRRRILIAALCLSAIGGGSVAGAVVHDQVYNVRKGQSAKLVGTEIYCTVYVPSVGDGKGKLTFDCSWWGKTRRVPGAVSVDFGAWGVDVARWDSTGTDYETVASYLNP